MPAPSLGQRVAQQWFGNPIGPHDNTVTGDPVGVREELAELVDRLAAGTWTKELPQDNAFYWCDCGDPDCSLSCPDIVHLFPDKSGRMFYSIDDGDPKLFDEATFHIATPHWQRVVVPARPGKEE